MYMCRLVYPADVTERLLAAKNAGSFSARIPTHAEVQQLLHASRRRRARRCATSSDLRSSDCCMVEAFRLGAVLHLRVVDVALDQGILTVREGKWRECFT
jgi:integrase/recombinase XerD